MTAHNTPDKQGEAPERIWINNPAEVTEHDQRWWYENPMAFPTVEYVRVAAVEGDGISWVALLACLERLRSKNRNPDNEWYHGWNAAIQCLINDVNSRAAASSPAPAELASELQLLRDENKRLRDHVADLNHNLEAAIKECNEQYR